MSLAPWPVSVPEPAEGPLPLQVVTSRGSTSPDARLSRLDELSLPVPRYPDERVFGPEHGFTAAEPVATRRCAPCGVSWAWDEGAACWSCGLASAT